MPRAADVPRPFSRRASRSPQDAFATELVCDVIEPASESFADLLDLGGFDHQRRSKHQSVAHHAHDEPVTLRRLIDAGADLERAVEGNAFLAVAHQLHAE